MDIWLMNTSLIQRSGIRRNKIIIKKQNRIIFIWFGTWKNRVHPEHLFVHMPSFLCHLARVSGLFGVTHSGEHENLLHYKMLYIPMKHLCHHHDLSNLDCWYIFPDRTKHRMILHHSSLAWAFSRQMTVACNPSCKFARDIPSLIESSINDTGQYGMK